MGAKAVKYPRADHVPSIDYAFTLLVICVSGNIAFTTGAWFRQEILLILSLVFALYRVKATHSYIGVPFVIGVIGCYIFISIWQSVSLGHLAIITITGFVVKLIIAAAVVSATKSFRYVFVRSMVWIASMGLIFHTMSIGATLVGVDVLEAARPVADIVGAQPEGVNERVNILFHTFMSGEHAFRNAGLFWEPGALAGYILAALAILSTLTRQLEETVVRRWRNLLAIGVLSTLSTTGYIILPLALLAVQLSKTGIDRDPIGGALLIISSIILILPVGFYAWELDFLGPKILELYTRAINEEPGWHLSRFGSIIFDWQYIQTRPLFGWGQSLATQFALHPYLDRYALGNGLTGFVRQMGLVGISTFLFALWHGLRFIATSGLNRFLVFAIIVAVLNGQYFLGYPIFLAFHFLSLEKVTPNRIHDQKRRNALFRHMGRSMPLRPNASAKKTFGLRSLPKEYRSYPR